METGNSLTCPVRERPPEEPQETLGGRENLVPRNLGWGEKETTKNLFQTVVLKSEGSRPLSALVQEKPTRKNEVGREAALESRLKWARRHSAQSAV